MKVAIIHNKDFTEVINTFGMQNKETYSQKTVLRVAQSLEQAGHNIAVLDGNMHIIERLQNFMPRVIEGEKIGMVFNMAYGIQGESRYTHVPSMLEMLGIPYVGSSPAGHALALDKVMTKIIWQNHQLPTPDFWVFNNSDDDLSSVTYPVIVKPKMESVSFGLIVVYQESELKEAIHHIVTEYQQQALVEQFIRGREFCVGLLGNSPVETFPVLEVDLEGDPNAIQTVDDKRKKPRQKICPANISEELAEKIQKQCIEAFNALSLRDFARVDLRMDENGQIYLIEINSMASLGLTGSYVGAAQVAGYDYSRLVNRILDVASLRYFADQYAPMQTDDTQKKIPLHSRLRIFIRSRQSNTELFLKKLVNINTYTRNADGVNQCANLILNEFFRLGFTDHVYPQLDVGNIHYLTNTDDEQIDFLILLPLDNRIEISEHDNFNETEQLLFGTGIWENKGGIAVCRSTLQSLRFARLLKKMKVGILLITDSTINGKFSKSILQEKSEKARHVISMHGGNQEGSVVLSRSGTAIYRLTLKLHNTANTANVASASYFFHKILAAIIAISKEDPEDVIAPYNVKFESNIFKAYAFGSAKLSVRFNTLEKFQQLDAKINKLVKLNSTQKKIFQLQFDGGVKRPPMVETIKNREIFKNLKAISEKIDVRLTSEHRWSSSDICHVTRDCPKIDGLGPVGGYDKDEHILRQSLTDKSLLLALFLNENKMNIK